jgi:molybdenum cofactor cytidylyltransferase
MGVIIDGVILAAGASSRMARPKALLRVGADTFVARSARTLRAAGCRAVRLVAGASADWAAPAAAELGLELVLNPDPNSEQVDSLRLALGTLDGAVEAVLVLPVDLPLVSEQTAQALVAAFLEDAAPLCVPFYKGVAGHPVLLGRELFHEVLSSSLEEGLRTLIMEQSRRLREVKVVDPGILVDIDTPDDYWRYIEAK